MTLDLGINASSRRSIFAAESRAGVVRAMRSAFESRTRIFFP